MSEVYFETNLPFKTNGVYTCKSEDAPKRSLFKRLLSDKDNEPTYSFIYIQQNHLADKNSPLMERYRISLFAYRGELMRLVHNEIKQKSYNASVKDVHLVGNVLNFTSHHQYLDGSTLKTFGGDRYSCKFYDSSCIVTRIDQKGNKTIRDYKFIEFKPTVEEWLNIRKK